MAPRTILANIKRFVGLKNIDKIINITQEPIGRTPRSNPATYTGVFDDIRALFAETDEAGPAATIKVGSVSTSPEDAARNAKAPASPASRCPSCRTSMSNATNAKENAITTRPCFATYKGKNIHDVLDLQD
jgi:excinuclease ABC subunit A